MGGHVALSGFHLMDPVRYALAQTHKGMRAQGGGVEVVPRSREGMGPLLEDGLPYPFLWAEWLLSIRD